MMNEMFPSKNVMLGVLADVIENDLMKVPGLKITQIPELLSASGHKVTDADIKIIRRQKPVAISKEKVAEIYRAIIRIKHGELHPELADHIRTELLVPRSAYGFRFGAGAAPNLSSTHRFHGDYIGVGPASLRPGDFFVIHWSVTKAAQGLQVVQTAQHDRTKMPIIYEGTGIVTGYRLDVKIENRAHIAGEPDEIITFLLSHDGTPSAGSPTHLYGVYVANGLYKKHNIRDVPSAALAIFFSVTPEAVASEFAALLNDRWIGREALRENPLFSSTVKNFVLAPSEQAGMLQGVYWGT